MPLPSRPLVTKPDGVQPKLQKGDRGRRCSFLCSVDPLPPQRGRVTLTHPLLMREGLDTLEEVGDF